MITQLSFRKWDCNRCSKKKEYVVAYHKLKHAARKSTLFIVADGLLNFTAFIRYCSCGHANFRLPSLKTTSVTHIQSRSMILENCTIMQNNDESQTVLSGLVGKQRQHSEQEQKNYCQCLESTTDFTNGSFQHTVLEFARRLLLPRLQKKSF